MQLKNINETFLPQLLHLGFGQELFAHLDQNKHLTVKSFAGSSPAVFAAELFLIKKKSLLFLTDDKEDALYITAELEDLLGKENVLYFPPTHLEPYQIEKTQNANLVLRTEVLNRIHNDKKPRVMIAPFGSLAEKVMKKDDFKAISHTIKTGDQLDFNFTEELLHQFNFNHTDFVSEPGEFSVRGGIVDVFSYSNEEPYRITFFGNEIESIKTFDIETQLSKEKIKEFQLVSNMNFSAQGTKVSLFDLAPKDLVVVTKNAFVGFTLIKGFYEKAEAKFGTLTTEIRQLPPEELFVSEENFIKDLHKFEWIDFTLQEVKGSGAAIIQLNQTPQPSFHKKFELLLEDLEEKQMEGFQTWISFSTEKQKERLESIFEDLISQQNSLSFSEDETDGKDISEKQSKNLFKSFKSELHEGFIDLDHKISVYTDHQIFDRYQRFKAKNSFAKSEQITLKDLMQMKVGDYITHIDHGIGKFMGLVKVNNNGKVQECFKLTYKNGDLLYVSIHSLNKISKYNGPDGREIVLSKLGSPAWKALKQKTKAKVKQIAFDLIRLYAERKTAKGFAFAPDSYLQNELEASFIYEDTPDQEKATVDVKTDMENETVMDRLICGDVGFGKTEIAIRAAFKAATDGKQVAILVPTTILAFQHYRSFTERLKDFPVTISYMNRFRSAKQKAETLEGLKTGKIDIVIGTHQLVGSSVKFKDLGLLIIDEEHKFGVAVKDKLKTIKSNVDTLTLTATPIPRTLQFSLMAARDLSVIKTPPPNRQPVETSIVGFDEELIRDAIS